MTDRAMDTVRTQTRLALHDACYALRWAPNAITGCETEADDRGAWSAEWIPAASSSPFNRVTLRVTSRLSGAASALEALVELRPESFAAGVVVNGDADFDHDATISGSGLYAGGDLRGRERLSFIGQNGSVALDGVHGDTWPLAAVHALGEITAAGGEIHFTGESASWPLDTDVHTGERDALGFSRKPDPLLLAALREHASSTGDALAQNVLDLSLLPPDPPDDARADALGYVVFVTPRNGEPLHIIGTRPPGSCRIALVVAGDATVGDAAATPVTTSGAIVVTGRLTVCESTTLHGHLYAGALDVAGQLDVSVPDDWPSALLPGLTAPTIVTLSDGLP